MNDFIRESNGSVATAQGGGKYRIKVIEWGKGSSAFYPRAVLERDGAKAFPAGTKIFANHPTETESVDRPERDVTKIVGKTLTDAVYEDGSLYADVYFSENFANHISEFNDVLGMSIYASGKSEVKTLDDYTGPVLTEFYEDPFNSIDVVTVPGAGGAILERLTESYKRAVTVEEPTVALTEGEIEKGKIVDEKVLEAIAGLTALVESFIESKTEEVKAVADAEAVAVEAEQRIEAYDAAVAAIEAAELLPSQAASLREAAKRGEDVTVAIESAKAIALEAKETFAVAAEATETGRISEAASVEDYRVTGLRIK